MLNKANRVLRVLRPAKCPSCQTMATRNPELLSSTESIKNVWKDHFDHLACDHREPWCEPCSQCMRLEKEAAKLPGAGAPPIPIAQPGEIPQLITLT